MGIIEYLCAAGLFASLLSPTTCEIAKDEIVTPVPPSAFVDMEAYSNIPSRCHELRRQVEVILQDRWHKKYTGLIMAQITQESACTAMAKSPVGAAGLMQIMPATAQDISDRIARELGNPDVFNPIWNLKAGISYQRNMFLNIRNATSECEQYSMALSSYNGGLGWLKRDRKLTFTMGGNQNKWFGIENVNHWSKRAMWAFKENRGYVQRIIHTLQPRFLKAGYNGLPLCV